MKNNKNQYRLKNVIELAIILGMVFLMMTMFLLVNRSVQNMTYLITDVKAPVRNIELISNELLLLWQMMSYAV